MIFYANHNTLFYEVLVHLCSVWIPFSVSPFHCNNISNNKNLEIVCVGHKCTSTWSEYMMGSKLCFYSLLLLLFLYVKHHSKIQILFKKIRYAWLQILGPVFQIVMNKLENEERILWWYLRQWTYCVIYPLFVLWGNSWSIILSPPHFSMYIGVLDAYVVPHDQRSLLVYLLSSSGEDGRTGDRKHQHVAVPIWPVHTVVTVSCELRMGNSGQSPVSLPWGAQVSLKRPMFVNASCTEVMWRE